jgi:DNA replication protein DnaC
MSSFPDGKFSWGPKAKRDYGPPAHADAAMLHRSPAYGPHICPQCYGARWMRQDVPIDDPRFGQLVKCERCGSVDSLADNERLIQLWRLSGLNPDAPEPATLDSFATPNAQVMAAFTAARKFSTRPAGWLTLHGSYGTGKSHLGEAITRRLLAARVPCLLMKAPDLLVYLGATERIAGAETNYENRMYWVQRTHVLVVDEVGREPSTPAVDKLRIMLFDYRYQQAINGTGGATVLLSNIAPEVWPDAALASRAMDARFTVVQTGTADYRRIKR